MDIGINTDNNEISINIETDIPPEMDVFTSPLFGPKGDKGEQGEQGIQGIQGETGEPGISIDSIEKTSTSGLIDTYTITYTDENTTTFDVTNGADGEDGQDGEDGFSPSATVSKVGKIATISITDKDGTTTETVSDGEDGTNGVDGFSPIANVVKVGNKATITITDETGTTTADIFDGTGSISDVQVDGVSVVEDGVADITLSTKQNVTDNTLTTTDKTIVGAINELNAKPSMPELDGETITTNSDDELQAIGVIDNNSGKLKFWSGTKQQYDAITTKDSNTLYNITDDQDITLSLLETIYPVGSIYITTNSTCPLSALFGTWQLVGADRVLQGAGTRGAVGSTLNESLPNIKGEHSSAIYHPQGYLNPTGAFTTDYINYSTIENSGRDQGGKVFFNASLSSSTYQDNAPVQQDAYLVNIFRRTA